MVVIVFLVVDFGHKGNCFLLLGTLVAHVQNFMLIFPTKYG